MSACIYYDLERVDVEQVAAARQRLPNAVEVFPTGSVRDPGVDAREVTPSARDPLFRAQFYDWLERIFTHLRSSGDYEHEGASLLEVARYSIFEGLAGEAQRWFALEDILRRFAPEKILWVTPGEVPDPAVTGTVVVQHPVGSERKLAPGVRETLRERLYPMAQDVRWLRHRAAALARRGLERAPVVFAEYFPSAAIGMIPIAERLERELGERVLWLAGRESVVDVLRQHDVQSVLLPSLARSPRFYPLSLRRWALIRKLSRDLGSLPNEILVQATGVNGRGRALPALRRVFKTSISDAFFWTAAFGDAFDSLDPRLVVSSSYASDFGRASALVARRRGARSAYVQHGISPARSYDVSYCQDSILVWGRSVKKSLVTGGVPEASIQVVGAASLDELSRRGAAASGELPAPGRPLRIAYMASRTAGSFVSAVAARMALAAIAGACELIPDAVLSVKLHPADHTGLVPKWLSEYPSARLATTKNAQELILANDLVVVVSSTTGLEACVARRPLVCLQIPGLSAEELYSDYGAALVFPLEGEDAPRRLALELDRFRESAEAQASLAAGRTRLLQDMLAGARGDGAERATAVLYALARDAD